MPGANLKEMVTNFPNNKRRRRKILGGTGNTLSREIIFFESFNEKRTDFRKTVETGMDPRLDAILGDSLFTPRTPFSHASEHT